MWACTSASVLSAEAQCILCQTGLTFTNPVAGRAVPITIQLRFTRQFRQGDTVELKLPGFSRNSGSTKAFAQAYAFDGQGVPSPAFSAASWDEAAELLTLHHINPLWIVANTLLRVTVLQNAAIRLPSGGLQANRTDFVMRVVAADETTAFEPLRQTQPVGVLYNTSIAFDPALPLTVSALSLNFTCGIQIAAGENATLELEQFTVASTSVVACDTIICSNLWDLGRTCSNGTMLVEVSYTGSAVKLSLMIADTVRDLELVSVTVPKSAGIVTPVEYERNNIGQNIMLSSQSVSGPVLKAPVEVSNKIPRYSISYKPSKASTGECSGHALTSGACTAWQSEQVDIDIYMVIAMAASPGDELRLVLPGFTRKEARQIAASGSIQQQACNSSGCNASQPLSGSALEKVLWDETVTHLRLVFNTSLPADRLVSVTIPASFGLHLPAHGLAANDGRITFEHVNNAVANDPAPLTSPAVGAFVSTTGNTMSASSALILPADRAGGSPVAGHFSFSLTVPISTGQCIGFCGTRDSFPLPFSVAREFIGPVTISLTLPGFTRAGGNLDHFEIQDSPAFGHASWVEASSTLVLTATAETQAGMLISVPLPEDAGISLPTMGLTHNSIDLRVTTNLLEGPVFNTSVARTPAIGAFTDAEISFNPAKAGVPITMTLTFSFSQNISAREYFTATLPGFFRTAGLAPTVTISATAGGSITPLWGDWSDTGYEPVLKMTVGAGGIQKDTTITVVVPASNQIHLRDTGTPTVEARYYWRVVNTSIVKSGWSVAELMLYSDTACTQRISLPRPSDAFGSSGTGILDAMNCSAFVYFTPSNSSSCSSGYRRARFAEIASCKLALCDLGARPEYLGARPEYLVGQGDGAYILGAGYGCQVLTGTSSHASADSICVPQETAAYNAFDRQSHSSWLHFADSKLASQVYVGTKSDGKVAVRCALIEQERFDSNWNVSSLALQSSADGVQWATIFESPVVKGANLLFRPMGPAGSKGFDNILLSSSSQRGPCKNVRVVTMPIGSFGASSSLSFGKPVPGGVTNITLTVTPEMEIDVGETITVKLNGFTANMSGSSEFLELDLLAQYQEPSFDGRHYAFVKRVSYNPPSAAPVDAGACSGNHTGNCTRNMSAPTLPLFNATWDRVAQTVTIKCGAVIYVGQILQVTLLESNTLRLPNTGIASSACGTGATVEPGSLRMGNGAMLPCHTCAGCVGVNENTMTIACNARAGPILAAPPTVVRTVQRIGTFFNTSIDFSALTNAYAVNITVHFTYNFDLLLGDKVYLHLPKFTGESSLNVPTFGRDASGLATAAWDGASSRLAITVTISRITALTPLEITIPAAANAILRSDGFTRNSPLLQLSSDATNGPVYPRAFDSSPAMGSFTSGEPSRISYTPGEFKSDGTPFMEGRISALTVGFALNQLISAGEHIVLGLDGFSRDGGDVIGAFNASAFDTNFSTVDTNGVFSSFMAASWAESPQRLTLTAAKQILANQRHIVLIPSGAGLRLPRQGLTQNDQRLTIGTNAVAGPNSGTPIAHSPVLNEVCGAECGAWSFTCGECRCGPCASDDQT